MIFVRTSIQFGDFVFDLWALSEQSLMLVNQLKRQDTDSLFVVCITLILLLYTAFSKSKCYVIFVIVMLSIFALEMHTGMYPVSHMLAAKTWSGDQTRTYRTFIF